MGKKQKFSNPFMDGLTSSPQTTSKPTNPLLEDFSLFKDPRIPTSDDSNRGIDLSKYQPYLGDNFVFTSASDRHRAMNQPTGKQVGNAVLRLLPNTALEFISMAANVLDVEDYASSDAEMGNWLNTWAQDQKKGIDQALPIHRKDPGRALDVGDTAWWMENGTNLIQSAAAFVGLGYLTGGASMAALGKGPKALKWLQSISKVSPTVGARITGGIATLSSAAMLNQAEGVGIATNVFDTVYKKKLRELQSDEGMMEANTPEQLDNIAKQSASEAASNALNFNRINILLNLSSASLFLRTPALTRQALTAPSIAKSFKRVGIEGIQEATEEEINLISEAKADKPQYRFEDALKDVFTREGAESGLLGFIGGAAQTGMTMSGRLLPTRNYEGKRMSQNQIHKQRFYDQQQAKARWDELSTGEKLQSNTDAFLTLQEQAELISGIEVATKDKNIKLVNELKDKLLINQASHSFNTGTTEQFLSAFQSIANLSEEQAAEKGIYNGEEMSDPSHYKNQARKAINTTLKLETAYNESREYINQTPVYEENGEVRYNGIYTNRAESITIDNDLESLDNINTSYKSSIEEILDKMGVEKDTYSFNSLTGELNLIDVKKDDYKKGLEELTVAELKDIAKSKNIPKAYAMNKDSLVNSLVESNETSKDVVKGLLKGSTYKGYKNILDSQIRLKDRQQNLESEYIELTSDKTQKDIQNYYKQSRKVRQDAKAKKKSEDTQDKNNNTKRADKSKWKKDKENRQGKKADPTKVPSPVQEDVKVKPETPIVKPDPANNINTSGKFQFSSNPDPIANKLLTDIVNVDYNKPDVIKKQLRMAVSEMLEMGKLTHEQEEALKGEANNAFRYLETIKREGRNQGSTLESQAEDTLKELATRIESDLSPTIKEETPSQKRRKKADLMLSLMDTAEQLDIKSFNSLALWANNKLGTERFSKIFVPFQDLYNGVFQGDRSTISYNDLFTSESNKDEFVDNDDTVINNTLPFGVYTVDHNSLDEVHKATIRKLAQLNALDIEGKYIDYGDLEDGVHKAIFGHNKIAYLAREYVKTISVNPDGSISVRKEDLDNNINEISDELLDYSQLKEGEEITLVALEKTTLADGSIVYKDGTIQYTDGRIEERNPQEVAPIGVMYKDKLLSSAYLHIADWINDENVAGDVKLDRRELIKLRRAVLNSGDKGVTTKVKNVSPGWLMESKEGIDLTLNNLPDVTEFGVVKNGVLYTSYENTTTVINDLPQDGVVSAVVPISDTEKMSINLNRVRLSNMYTKSIRQAVSLHFTGYKDNPIVKQLNDNFGINILTIEGLRDYVTRFVYSYDKFDGNTKEFEDFLKEQKSNVHLLRITGNSIEFGTGSGVNIGGKFNSLSENSPRQYIDIFLDNLERHLGKMYMNMEIERLEETEFVLPIIEDGVVKGEKESYNNYIKRHTTTKFFSTTTSTNKPIYTIQRTLEFDTKNIIEGRPEIEELKREVIGEKEEVKDQERIEEELRFFQYDNVLIGESFEIKYNWADSFRTEVVFAKSKDGRAWLIGENKDGARWINFKDHKGDRLEYSKETIDRITKQYTKPITKPTTITRTLTTPTGKKVTISSNDIPPSDLSPKIIEETDFTKILSNIPTDLYIKDMGFVLQNTVIDYITSDVLSKIVIDKDILKKSDILDEYIEYFREIRTLYTEMGNETMAALAQQVVDNGDDIMRIITKNIAKMDVTDVQLVQLDDESGSNDLESPNEKQRFDSEAIFKENPISSLTGDIKKYLSAVYDVEDDGAGNLVSKKVIFGLDAVVPFDVVVNDLYAILANNNEDYTPPVFDIMIDRIKEHIELKPYLDNVVVLLEDAPQDIKSKFVTAMSKHYTHHKYIYRIYDRENKSYKLIPLNSDNFSNQTKVLQDWNNRLKKSKYIQNTSETVEDLVIINKEDINNRFKSIVEDFNNGKPVVVKLRSWLDDLGVKIPDIVLVKLKSTGLFVDGNRVDFEYMLTNPIGVFNLINKNFTERGDETIISSNPLQDKSISALAKEVSKGLLNVYSNSFSDVRGETYFGYSPNKYFIERFQNITHDISLLNKLKTASFSKNSSWLNELLKSDDKGTRIDTTGVFYRNFQYFTVDGMKDQKGNEGKKLENMSPADHEFFKLSHFFNQGGKIRGQKSRRIMELLYPTISDKSLMLGLRQVGYHLNTNVDGNIFETSPMWDILFDNLVQPEVNRIIEYQTNPNKYDIKGFNEGAGLFYFVPELNQLESIWENDVLKPIVKGSVEYQAIVGVIKTHVESQIEQKKDIWRTYGFVDTTKEGKETLNISDGKYAIDFSNNLSSVANNYVVNYLLANANTYQMFIGDPALFYKADSSSYPSKLDHVKSTFINVGVRLASHIAPGLDIPADKGESYSNIFLADRKGDISINKEYLSTVLSEEDYEQYLDIEGTDAQEFTTLEEHLNIMLKQGRITKEQYNTLLEKEKNDIPLDVREMGLVLQPMKLVYNNKVWDGNMEKIVYVKSSSFPLIKQLTRGLEIDKLRIAMQEGKTDRVAFSTAIKLGNIESPINIFNKDGTIKSRLKFKKSDLQVLPRYGHRRQLEVPFKESSNTINDGTQQSKLLFTNLLELTNFTLKGTEGKLTGKELRDKFNSTYGDLFKLKYKNLMNELTTDKKLDLEKIQKLLYEEGIKRNFPINDLEAITIVERNNKQEFIVPLWATASASKFESLLSSIVDNRIRKRIVSGKAYVLGTEEGFQVQKVKEVKTVGEALALQPNIIFDEKWLEESGGKLRPMRVENGKVKPDEVILPMKFYNNEGRLIDVKQFVNSEGYLDTERIDPQLLEQFGFRIPTQGHNSMSYIKVVGFLPYESGDLLIAPRDFTRRMGSDFDVDKLYVNSYNTIYNQKEGTIKRVEKGTETWSEDKDLQDQLLDIHFSVLKNPSNKVQSQIHTPLGFGLLENLADDIDKAYEGTIYAWSGLSEEYQKNRYLSARGAKIGVGAFSLDNTLNSLLQGNDNIVLEKTEEEEINGKIYRKKVPVVIKLGDRTSNEMSKTTVNTTGKKRFKSEVISAYQSAAVDNEKVQLLNRLNINRHTFSAVKILNQLGFEEDVVMPFINQPIIRDYVRLTSLAQDSSSNWDTDKVEAELNRLYPTDLDVDTLDKMSNVSISDMESMIFGYGDVFNNNLQRSLLNKFFEVTSYGDSLSSVQSTINSDSAGVGKDLFYSLIKEDQILNLVNNTTVVNAHLLLGNYWSADTEAGWQDKSQEERDKIIQEKKDQGYVQTKGQLYIQPTTINGYASVYGTIVNAKLWNKLFSYDSPILLKAIEEITEVTGRDSNIISVKAEAYKQSWNFIKSYLLSQTNELTEGSLIEERQRLLYDTKDNVSLASIIDDIKDKKLLINNPFINRLETEIFNQVLPSRLTYNSSLAEGQDERYIYSGFINLMASDKVLGTYNGIEYTTKILAQDLITHQFITGGVQRANQFIKYIPIQYLDEIGYYDMISNLNMRDRNTFGYREDNFFATTEQYLQHNPKDVAIYDKEGYTFNSDESVVTVSDPSKAIRPYISFPSNKTKKGFKLYKRVSPTEFEQLDTLGDRDMRETDFYAYRAKTTIVSNKSPIAEIKSEDIPQTEEEIKEFVKVVSPTANIDEAKDVPPDSLKGRDYEYGLREKDSPGIKKLGNALNYIVNKSDNKFYSWYAEQLLKNINKLPNDIKVTIDITLELEGKTDYNKDYRATNILINPLEIDTKEDFERVILHEITHAFTKEAIYKDSDSATITKLNSLFKQFQQQVRFKYTGEVVEKVNEQIERGQRTSVKIKDARIIRAASSFDEFITEAMSNKDVQSILDSYKPTTGFKQAWDSFKSLVADLLESFGFQKGKALDYTISNVISLIDTPTPSTSATGELDNGTTRTVEFINTKFNLVESDGDLIPKNNAKEISKWINDNIDNLEARVITGKYVSVKDKNIIIKKEKEKKNLLLDKNGNTLVLYRGYALKEDREAKNILETIAGTAMDYMGRGIYFSTSESEARRYAEGRTDKSLVYTAEHPEGKISKHYVGDFAKVSSYVVNIEQANIKIYDSYDAYLKDKSDKDIYDIILLRKGTIGAKPEVIVRDSNRVISTDSIEKDISLYDLSISRRAAQEEGQKELPVTKLLLARRTRVKMLDRLINRADANNEFAKAEELKQQKQELQDSVETIMQFTTLEDIETVALQDLAEVSSMLDTNLSESDILYALKITNLWQKGIDVFFDEDTITSDVLRDKFKSIEGTAESYSEILYNKLVDLTNQFVREHTGIEGNINVEQVMASMKDISKIEANALNVSRNDNILLGAIYNSVRKANYAATDEAREIMDELDVLIKTITPVLESMNGKSNKFEVFRQQFSDGLYTGNLVSKFTPEFEDTLRGLNKWLVKIDKPAVFKKQAKERKEKIITFDVRKLFPRKEGKYTTEQVNKYKQELKDLLGNDVYNMQIRRQERMIERYREDREHNLQRILSKYDIEQEVDLSKTKAAYNEFKTWILQNSPYEANTQLLDGKAFSVEGKFIPPLATLKYLVEVPRKTGKDGKDLGFYDDNFSKIEQDKDLLEFYNYITDVFDKLKIYLPQEVQDRIQFGGLPEISKTFLELSYDVKGGKEAMSVIWDKLRESVRTEDTSDITYADIDPVTGEADRYLEVKMMKDNRQQYKDYIYRKAVTWSQANPDKTPSDALKTKWRHEAKDMLAQKKSYDLGKVVKAYSMIVLAYKHKSRIEDQLKAAESIIKRSKEMELTAKKRPLKDEKGQILYKDEDRSFVNMKSSLDYFMDVFYGHARKLEGVTGKDILTTEEEKTKEEIVRLLETNKEQYNNKDIREEVYLQTEKKLNEQLDKLGGIAVWSKRGDNVLKYIQLKVMGWNLFSGFSNVGFGWIANFIEAADGRVFNQTELLDGYKLVLHSIGTNLTFGKVRSDTSTKIRSLMDRFDFLADMSNELYTNSIPSQFTKSTRWLAPYNITQRTEYINQAPILIALMKQTKTDNGKSLWEQFDKDGKWIGEDKYPTNIIIKFRLKAERIRDITHGDYGSPLKLKEKILGRGLSQFRTWMFEGFAQRFEPYKFDPNLGIARKGRYISLYSNYFKKLGFLGGLADLATNLLRKLTFQGTRFDKLTDAEIFNEVDAANMRKVLSEITIYMGITTTAILLKMLSKGLDDEEKYMANYLINHSSRLRTDILFYFNPIEFRKLLRDPIPAATLIKDITEWTYATGNFVLGKDIYETGVYAGESKLARETMQLLPFGTQVYRNIAASKTQY